MCARTGSRFKVTQVTMDMWRAGCGECRVPEIRTDHSTKREESGPYCRRRSQEFPGTISCKALRGQHVELPLPLRAKGLWSHQVVLQGQKRPWNFILPTSCFSARAAAQASQSHQRVMCGDEPLRARPFSMNNLIVCSLHTSESGKLWCWLLMPHPFSSVFLQGPIHVHPNELGVGYGLSLVPCER